jgi:hypothetical protein
VDRVSSRIFRQCRTHSEALEVQARLPDRVRTQLGEQVGRVPRSRARPGRRAHLVIGVGVDGRKHALGCWIAET